MRNWDDVIAAITRVVSGSSHKYADQTLSNARGLSRMASERYKVPDDVSAGYWPTIQPIPIELEIHEASFELYEFSNGSTKISEFARGSSDSIPETLLHRLDQLISL